MSIFAEQTPDEFDTLLQDLRNARWKVKHYRATLSEWETKQRELSRKLSELATSDVPY